MDTESPLERLRAAFAERLDEIISVAQESRPGEVDRWHAVLEGLGVEPLSHGQTSSAVACGFRPTRGALPLEVRRAFEVVQRDFGTEAQRVLSDDAGAHPGLQNQLLRFPREMGELANRKVKGYVASIRPKTTLQGIFANAASSSMRYDKQSAGTSSLTCSCCGAGRPADSDLRTCAFCGNPFLASEVSEWQA